MKSLLLAAIAVVLSLAIPAFAAVGQRSRKRPSAGARHDAE